MSNDILSETNPIFNVFAFSGKKKKIGANDGITHHFEAVAARRGGEIWVEFGYTSLNKCQYLLTKLK